MLSNFSYVYGPSPSLEKNLFMSFAHYLIGLFVFLVVQPLWEAVWSFLKKLKMELPFDPVIPLLGIYQETQNTNSKGYRHPSQDVEAAPVPISR